MRRRKMQKPGFAPGSLFLVFDCLYRLNILCLKAFITAHDIKLYALAFLKAAEAVRVDGGEVNEDVLVIALARNEAEAFGIVKPLDCTLFHLGIPCIDIR
jgi:hypothetical protein